MTPELWDRDTVRAKDLYFAFRAYEDIYHPGTRTSLTEWGTEMTRLIENQGSSASFEKFRDARGNGYRHRSSMGAKKLVLVGGATAQG